ncbi:MAG: hypothetical protein ACI9EF_000956 [Pseudohongiellaceae bacterium]|jgi:hypothetical protein
MLRAVLTATLLFGLTACASGPAPMEEPPAPMHPALVEQYAYTHTHEIRFGMDGFVSGYLVEFLTLPDGIEAERDYPAGTVLLQDLQLKTIGMISPGNQAYAFDESDQIVNLGVGGRDDQVAAIDGRTERAQFTALF